MNRACQTPPDFEVVTLRPQCVACLYAPKVNPSQLNLVEVGPNLNSATHRHRPVRRPCSWNSLPTLRAHGAWVGSDQLLPDPVARCVSRIRQEPVREITSTMVLLVATHPASCSRGPLSHSLPLRSPPVISFLFHFLRHLLSSRLAVEDWSVGKYCFFVDELSLSQCLLFLPFFLLKEDGKAI
ncbi:hypothetical protein BJX65DRAFT_107418 [Aspergillus insuetus]